MDGYQFEAFLGWKDRKSSVCPYSYHRLQAVDWYTYVCDCGESKTETTFKQQMHLEEEAMKDMQNFYKCKKSINNFGLLPMKTAEAMPLENYVSICQSNVKMNIML